MASTAKQSGALPVINIAPWLDADAKGRLSTSAALHSACLEYGFFYLDISSFVDPSEPEELAQMARDFFTLPQGEKDKISLANEDHARGYQRLKENVTNGLADNHEAIDFYRPVENPDKSRPLWGTNQWPALPGFRAKYEAWIEKMKQLGLVVMEAMAAGLGMTPEEWAGLRAQVDDSFWVMRIIGYPPLPTDDAGFSCGAHKDYGCLTFLWADPTKGALQVFLSQSSPGTIATSPEEQGVWIDADPIPGCVVCNIGEMWEVWTNGLYKSTLHRVMHQGSNYRISIPFFFEPNFDALVAPLAGALRIQDGQHGEKEKDTGKKKTYVPTRYGEFLMKKVGGNFATGKGRYADD